MIIKLLAQNIKRGGHLDDNNQPEGRWDAITTRVRTEKPDFLLLSEVVGWDKNGHRDVARAMDTFNMVALPIAPSPSNYPTLLMYNPDTVGHWQHWNTDFADQTVHGFGVATFDVGLPEPLTVIPVHIGPFTQEQVLHDTAMIAKRGYRYGRFAILGGDFNLPPARDSLSPDYSLKASHQFRYKTTWGRSDQGLDVELNLDPARAMIESDYIDCADYLYDKTNEQEYLRPTSPDAGRIDRFYVTYAMREAIQGYQCLSDQAVSDHAGITLTLDTGKIDTGYSFSLEEFSGRKHLI